MASETFNFQADINQLLSLIINTFYSQKEIFIRELVSNASDALDKIRYKSLTDKDAPNADLPLEIRIRANKEANTLTIEDTGVGMSKQDLVTCLGTIASSGTRAFMESLNKKDGAITSPKPDLSLIGQFGVGFYSAYLVADKVTVITKCNDDVEYTWESNAGGSFTITTATATATDVTATDVTATLVRGTRIILQMKEDQKEFLDESRIRELIKKHNEYIGFPIMLEVSVEREVEVKVKAEADDVEAEDAEVEGKVEDDVEGKVEDAKVEVEAKANKAKVTVLEWVQLNKQKPIWMRDPDSVSHDDYAAFYKSLGSDWDEHQAVKHFKVEGQLDFSAILYVPKRAPFDMFSQSNKRAGAGMKLYVRRVFITDQNEDLMPEWLSFVKGVVDSDDLPLNISREMLQQNSIIKVISKNLVKKCIELFTDLATDPAKYKLFYEQFSKNLKLGIHEDSNTRDKLTELLRFYSSSSMDSMTTLADYVKRMDQNPSQKKIYYLVGDSKDVLIHSPFVERLKNKGFEILFMTDTIDEYMMQQLREYKEKTFMNCAKDMTEEDMAESEDIIKAFEPVCKAMKEIIGDKVIAVKVSSRLTDTPCILTTDQYGWTANMERLMKAQALRDTSQMAMMNARKTLEINAGHKIIKELQRRLLLVDGTASTNDKTTKELIQLLFEGAMLHSGFTLENPTVFVKRIHRMVMLGLSIGEEEEEEEEFNGGATSEIDPSPASLMEEVD